MKSKKLNEEKCAPCKAGTPRLTPDEAQKYFSELAAGWVMQSAHIYKRFTFKDFSTAMVFINKMAKIAEAEAHHPNFGLGDYRYVDVYIWTHAIAGLSRNDFILAAKIDAISV